MFKEVTPVRFVPSRPIGGDDPTSAIGALTNINARLEARNQELQRNNDLLWKPLAALALELGGKLIVNKASIESLPEHIALSVDATADDFVLITLVDCKCGASHDAGERHED